LLEHPHVGDIRGEGLLIGIEFVQEKHTKKPFSRERKYAENFVQKALNNGLVLWPNIGHADGKSGDLVLVAPPFIIGQDEVSQIVDLLGKTLEDMKNNI
jgi:adenosylmethionine-8-amino-7-oxononanoate aminotransferase